MAKIRIGIGMEVETDEEVSPAMRAEIEMTCARWLETLEATLDAHFVQLRKRFPNDKFRVGMGLDDEGEEWKEGA